MSDSTTGSPHLPPLSVEIRNEILKFCDQDTLAKTSMVSLAFLQMASRLLYRDVEIHGYEALEKLFCSRDDTRQRQLTPYLSLDNIQTFTFLETRSSFPLPPPLKLDRSKHSALSLQRLFISLPPTYDRPIRKGQVRVSSFISERLIPLFQPSECFIEGDFAPEEAIRVAGLLQPFRPGPPVLLLPLSTTPSLSFLHLKNSIVVNIKDLPLRRLVIEVSESVGAYARSLMRNQIVNLACSNYPLEGISGDSGLEIWMGLEERKVAMTDVIQERLEERFGTEEGKETRLGRVQVLVRQS